MFGEEKKDDGEHNNNSMMLRTRRNLDIYRADKMMSPRDNNPVKESRSLLIQRMQDLVNNVARFEEEYEKRLKEAKEAYAMAFPEQKDDDEDLPSKEEKSKDDESIQRRNEQKRWNDLEKLQEQEELIHFSMKAKLHRQNQSAIIQRLGKVLNSHTEQLNEIAERAGKRPAREKKDLDTKKSRTTTVESPTYLKSITQNLSVSTVQKGDEMPDVVAADNSNVSESSSNAMSDISNQSFINNDMIEPLIMCISTDDQSNSIITDSSFLFQKKSPKPEGGFIGFAKDLMYFTAAPLRLVYDNTIGAQQPEVTAFVPVDKHIRSW